MLFLQAEEEEEEEEKKTKKKKKKKRGKVLPIFVKHSKHGIKQR